MARKVWPTNKRDARRTAGALGLLGVTSTLVAQHAADANFGGTQRQVSQSALTAGDLYLTYNDGTTSCGVSPGANPKCRLTLAVNNLYPGYIQYRTVAITNAGSVAFSTLKLAITSNSSGAIWTDSTNGAQVAVDVCTGNDGTTPTSWVESGSSPDYSYACASTNSQKVLSATSIGSLTAGTALSGSRMAYAAGSTNYYRIAIYIPSGSTDPATAGGTPAVQGSSASLTFTFSGTQRAGTNQ